MTRRAVGLKTNKPERVAATRASVAKTQIARRFTQVPLPELTAGGYFGMKPLFRACPNLALFGHVETA